MNEVRDTDSVEVDRIGLGCGHVVYENIESVIDSVVEEGRGRLTKVVVTIKRIRGVEICEGEKFWGQR